jgi:hypothetical protein
MRTRAVRTARIPVLILCLACLAGAEATGDCNGSSTPRCDRSCAVPNDIDDCALCCTSNSACTHCCEGTFTGEDKHICAQWCDRMHVGAE